MRSATTEKSALLDDLWIGAAGDLGFPVVRPVSANASGEASAYIHYDGQAIVVAADQELDEDDSLAQLVFHELCHHLIEGPASAGHTDWGLDNRLGASMEIDRERACLRLQAHLAGEYGLADFMCPTHPPSRAYYKRLGERPLGLALAPALEGKPEGTTWARQLRPVRRALAVLTSAHPQTRRGLAAARGALCATARLLYQ